MPFDAADLYWPPFRSLYAQLEAIKLEPEAVDPASLKSSLQEYTPWLTKGLGGFKKPNETSRKALETETQLLVGAQKLPVEAGLRNATLATSRALVRSAASSSLYSACTALLARDGIYC